MTCVLASIMPSGLGGAMALPISAVFILSTGPVSSSGRAIAEGPAAIAAAEGAKGTADGFAIDASFSILAYFS